ncbi:glycine zipper 2TM domain-containing protein [Pseudoduganella chitinolytica]|uniref:Glycine zipper 2TM domain-containing protein n=1 Tax=Pseudoduganella chitinolytica TaxID=34070 RepID=A0ABY8BJG1_9BURK|nr:glycine zipper 2TM domain-containing protein [Pseudoduganella chitinolytica]WEF35098.1 glycine zipper 2TM domain-containing protein [Pseudoduganella chitinolytica]
MDNIATVNRIHPLLAAAAVSVIAVSGTGIAALTGVLPSSKADPVAYTAPMSQPVQQPIEAGQVAAAPQLAAGQSNAQQLAPQSPQQAATAAPQAAVQAPPERVAARVVERDTDDREPVARKPVQATPARTHVARPAQPTYAPAPVAQESKPNYVAIGTGAVVGGLLGNQVGDGNGKKLATLAGIIGGGYLGNEIANRNK